MTSAHVPLGTIGILGAGQLAMMLAEAAANLGVRTVVYAPENALERPVGDQLVVGTMDDADAMTRFAEQVDVITFETENISVDTVETVAGHTLVRPPVDAVRISQDRLLEKRFVQSVGAATAAFAPIDTTDDIADALAAVGLPAIIKTRRMGYDGKGQARLSATASAPEAVAAWESLGSVPCIVEAMVPFDHEISVVAARSADGSFVPFDPGINHHVDGILRTTTVPATGVTPPAAVAAALEVTQAILDGSDYVGVAGVEFFVVGSEVLVNEIAPRVHNSGHWTQLGCVISQFEQHVRAITGRPLGDGSRLTDVVMTNLIGDDVQQLPTISTDPAASVVLYGKSDVRPGRKMGHVNRASAPTEASR